MSKCFEVNVENSFAAGHFLRGYRGKCENPHGQVRITARGETLDETGLLCDFKELQTALKDVMSKLDHQFLNELEFFLRRNPSAEWIAKYFHDEINGWLCTTTARVRVNRVKVWETEHNAATYFE